ncbi:MAG: hypothetical protein ACOH5I_17050 [Oligoflexus sp.]
MADTKKSALISLWIGSLAAGNLLAKSPDASHLNVEPSPLADASREERIDYQKCRKRALTRSQKLSKERRTRYLKLAVTQCREQYPAIAVLQECKREAFRAYRDHKDYLKSALEQCRQDYRQFVFQPASILPIKTHNKGEAFFAGIGLNHPFPVNHLARVSQESNERRIGNFNCQSVVDVYTKQTSPEHILFGNDMLQYRPFQNVEPEALQRILISQSKQDKQDDGQEAKTWTHPEWGMLHPSTNPRQIPHYFPLAFCHFDRDMGSIYRDIKIYYFIDREKRTLIPYFGVAFYELDAQVSRTDLLEQLRSELGEEFEIRKDVEHFQIIAAHPIEEVDPEGEPYNLCRHPRKHEKIAVIARHPDSPFASYFLLSNLGNLCKHGDQLASRYLKQGL